MSLKTYIYRGIKYIFKGIPNIRITANITQLTPNNLLKDKVVLITGGSSGIGKAIAQSMLAAGANIIITGRDENRLQNSLTDILNSPRIKELKKKTIETLVLDNNDITIFNEKINLLIRKFGRIDILVNNAGIMGGDISNCNSDEFQSIIDTNLRGTFFLSKIVAAKMIEYKIHGNILNISSSSSIRPASSAYALSKWGIRGLTLGLAKSLSPHGIVVNAIAPGPTATSMLNMETESNLYFPNPLGRYIKAEEIGEMAVILTSNLGRSIIGDTIFMTGGSGLLTFDDINYKF